jgi:DNA polymerase-3 subunit epsilon
MKLERPIVFFDVETTGLSLSEDRIIEISMIKQFPNDEDGEQYNLRINPDGRPIHPEAFEKHGIEAEDLRYCPTFKQSAQEIYDFIKDCDLGGYNCKRFDIPILIEEFLRAKIPISIKSFKVIDVYQILLKAEPRTLEGTYKRFFGKELEGAHGAEVDVIATIDILKELEKAYSIPDTVDEIHKYTFDDDSIDLENKLKRTKEGSIVFMFGKHKNKTIQEVYMTDPGYYNWIISKSDMTSYTKSIFRNIVEILNKPKS